MSGSDRVQAGLFGPPPPPVDAAEPAPGDQTLADHLPPEVRLGTSSWTFEGWAGHVYDRPAKTAVLARHGLAAYARHPLLGGVGIDRTWYAPVEASVLAEYAEVVPRRFRFLVKAHADCTTAVFSDDARNGERRGQVNPRFLDPAWAEDVVLGPVREGLGDKCGVVLFQLPPTDPAQVGGPEAFAERLHTFLAALPSDVPLAVELRSRALFTARFGEVLEATGVSPCLNVWTDIQDLRLQARLSRAAKAPQLVIRWLLRPGMRYLEARERYAPFSELKDPDPDHREVIARAAVAYARAGKRVQVIVTNRAEGCAPASIRLLAQRMVALDEELPADVR